MDADDARNETPWPVWIDRAVVAVALSAATFKPKEMPAALFPETVASVCVETASSWAAEAFRSPPRTRGAAAVPMRAIEFA